MLVIVPAVIMIVIAAYAYSSVAPGVASIPMQWSLTEAHLFLPRLFAFAAFPVVGIVALLILNHFSIGTAGIIFAAALVTAIQLLHIGLAYRWFAKTRS
jgi:uncharacterized oligopeptide transporter (OPT) family protein